MLVFMPFFRHDSYITMDKLIRKHFSRAGKKLGMTLRLYSEFDNNKPLRI